MWQSLWVKPRAINWNHMVTRATHTRVPDSKQYLLSFIVSKPTHWQDPGTDVPWNIKMKHCPIYFLRCVPTLGLLEVSHGVWCICACLPTNMVVVLVYVFLIGIWTTLCITEVSWASHSHGVYVWGFYLSSYMWNTGVKRSQCERRGDTEVKDREKGEKQRPTVEVDVPVPQGCVCVSVGWGGQYTCRRQRISNRIWLQ